MKTEKKHETDIHLNYYMKFFRELYDSNYNYVKGCSFLMRYLNELILKGGVKRVSLLLPISINYNHFFF